MCSSDFFLSLGPLSAKNVTITHVTPTEIFLHWEAPDPVSFHHYLVTILDVENNETEEVFIEKLNTSTTIGNLTSFHHYLIHLFTVAERGTLSGFKKPISVVTGKYGHFFCLLIKNTNCIFCGTISLNLNYVAPSSVQIITAEHLFGC